MSTNIRRTKTLRTDEIFQATVPASKPITFKPRSAEEVFVVLVGDTPAAVFRKEEDAQRYVEDREQECREMPRAYTAKGGLFYFRVFSVALK